MEKYWSSRLLKSWRSVDLQDFFFFAMKTVVSTYYLEKTNELAAKFASERAQLYPEKSRKKVYKSTLEVFKSISLYLYLRLSKASPDKTSFKFNHISSIDIKKLSCKLYKKVLRALEESYIIKANSHYYHGKARTPFTKSYLIHRDILHKIDETKRKLEYRIAEVEIPEKVEKVLRVSGVIVQQGSLDSCAKLNRFNRREYPKREVSRPVSYYSQLEYDEKKLDEFCDRDEFLYNYSLRRLRKLRMQPKLIKGRWYHPFHELSKKFRESVLTLDGESLKEVFDIPASDLHMLAKHLENVDGIPERELIRFQKDVKNDFRRELGARRDGKCTAQVKRAFKVYLNMKRDAYSRIREGSIVSKIDSLLEKRCPKIREYIKQTDGIWQIAMDNEFKTMSDKLVSSLSEIGVKALTCHDAVYVKKSVDIPRIREMFYEKLDLLSDRTERMLNL